jgi:hypothetical protein
MTRLFESLQISGYRGFEQIELSSLGHSFPTRRSSDLIEIRIVNSCLPLVLNYCKPWVVNDLEIRADRLLKC